MPFDAPQDEPVLTRRARRLQSAVPATPDAATEPTLTRAQRRLAAAAAAAAAASGEVEREPEAREGAGDQHGTAESTVVLDRLVLPEACGAHTPAAATGFGPASIDPAPSADDSAGTRNEPLASGTTIEDAFESASRALRFGAADAPRRTVPLHPASDTVTVEPLVATAPRRRRRRRARGAKRTVAAVFSMSAMGAAGLLAVSMATPVGALSAAVNSGAPLSVQVVAAQEKPAEEGEIQAIVATSVDTELNRAEQYQAATNQQLASDTGITLRSPLFVNDPNGDIQWPFAVGVPVTDTWGPRWGSFHHGVDFTPGEGADIQTIADGTVRIATESGGVYGVYVVVDHEIDGRKVSSLYAHMLSGSLAVEVGDEVTVGTLLGNTGNTGLSYGPHTHFELTVDGTRIDPLPWLRENAGG